MMVVLCPLFFPVLVHPAFSIYRSLLKNVDRFNAIVKSLSKSTNEPNAQKPPAELRVCDVEGMRALILQSSLISRGLVKPSINQSLDYTRLIEGYCSWI